MMGAAIDNILCDHNHSHSIIYVVMNLSSRLKYFNNSLDMSCPIIAVKRHVTVGYGRMFSAKLLKGYHLTRFLIFRMVSIYTYNTQLKYCMKCDKCNKCMMLQRAVLSQTAVKMR
jgi:hypothetical protein